MQISEASWRWCTAHSNAFNCTKCTVRPGVQILHCTAELHSGEKASWRRWCTQLNTQMHQNAQLHFAQWRKGSGPSMCHSLSAGAAMQCKCHQCSCAKLGARQCTMCSCAKPLNIFRCTAMHINIFRQCTKAILRSDIGAAHDHMLGLCCSALNLHWFSTIIDVIVKAVYAMHSLLHLGQVSRSRIEQFALCNANPSSSQCVHCQLGCPCYGAVSYTVASRYLFTGATRR